MRRPEIEEMLACARPEKRWRVEVKDDKLAVAYEPGPGYYHFLPRWVSLEEMLALAGYIDYFPRLRSPYNFTILLPLDLNRARIVPAKENKAVSVL